MTDSSVVSSESMRTAGVERATCDVATSQHSHQHLLHLGSTGDQFPLQARPKRSGPNEVGISIPGAIPRSRYLAWSPGPSGKPPNPASRAVTPKADGDEHPQNCNAPLRCHASQAWHALSLCDRTTDATDTGLLGLQQYGCCVDHLYQNGRIHDSLNKNAVPRSFEVKPSPPATVISRAFRWPSSSVLLARSGS
jgi:hypothetical protein